MAPPKKAKPKYNENAMIRGALRQIWQRHPFKEGFIKSKRIEYPPLPTKRGLPGKLIRIRYVCDGCGKETQASHQVPDKRKPGKKKTQMLIFADHVNPVIDPEVGFVDWNTFTERLFVRSPGDLQLLCTECHNVKTRAERALAVERRRREKQEAETGPS